MYKTITTIAAAKLRTVGGSDDKNLWQNVTDILNAIIFVLGLVSVVFIIYGGVQYISSSGDPSKVEKAKKTILYSCIGLIVSVLAFAIVNFVISDILGQGSSSSSSSSKGTNSSSKKKKTSYIDQRIQNDIAFLDK